MDRPERAAAMEYLRRKGTEAPAAELRALCAGVSPPGAPIPARLKSPRPLDKPWAALVDALKNLHAQILDIVIKAGDRTPTVAKAPVTMVIIPGSEWTGSPRVDRGDRLEGVRTDTAHPCARASCTSRAQWNHSRATAARMAGSFEDAARTNGLDQSAREI